MHRPSQLTKTTSFPRTSQITWPEDNKAKIVVATTGKGTYEITNQLASAVTASAVQTGAVTVFVRHTNCSLITMEDADPTAHRDLQEIFERLVPEDTPYFEQTAEEGDDSTRTFARSSRVQAK